MVCSLFKDVKLYLVFTLRSTSHLELILVYDVTYRASLTFSYDYTTDPMPFIEKPSFPNYTAVSIFLGDFCFWKKLRAPPVRVGVGRRTCCRTASSRADLSCCLASLDSLRPVHSGP